MSYLFQKEKTYRIGNLASTQAMDPGTNYPKFGQSPPPVSISGSNLFNLGIKDFSTYLKKNPHNFKMLRTVYCYEWDASDNQYKKVDEGNPIPKMDTQKRGETNSNLSDNRQILQEYGSNSGMNTQLCDMFENRIKSMENELQQRNSTIQELTQKIMDKDGQLAELRAEKRILDIDNEKMQGALEGYIGRYGGQNGLSDGGGSSLMDKGIGILDKIASTPQGAEAIAAIASKIAGFLGGKGTEPAVYPDQPANPQFQNPAMMNQMAKPNFSQPVNGAGGSLASI